jgi:Concanavalin A-like lectin/glucanases superfamily
MPVAENAMNKGRELADRLAGVANKSTVALFIIIALLLIVIIVVYIVYRIRRSDLQNVIVLRDSTRLYNMKQVYRFDASQIPPTLNGQEFTFSFWLYLVDYPVAMNHAMLFCRGGSGQSVDKSNPVVFMDKNTNKMHIAVRTTAPRTTDLNPSDVNILDTILKRQSGFLTATIDYVPLQRWVHIMFVVQDNLLTVFMDGDIYTVANIADLSSGSVRPVFASTNGDVFVGALPGLNQQSRSFMAKLQFYNFAVMHNDVRNSYMEGPTIQSIMGRMGLPGYGVRSPIYRLDA